MGWGRYFGWGTLAIATLAIIVLSDALTLPEPTDAIVLDHAIYQTGADGGSDVALPHATFPPAVEPPETAKYLIRFELPAAPEENLFLYIPALNRAFSVSLNGETLLIGTDTFSAGPLATASNLLQLPRVMLARGANRLTITVYNGRSIFPTYLSRLYLGSEAALTPRYRLRVFLVDYLKIGLLSAHVLLGLGLICAFFFRPRDPLFSWLAAFLPTNLVIALGMFFGFQPVLQPVLPYIGVLAPMSGLLFIGVALALIERPPPKALAVAAVASSFGLLPFAAVDGPFAKVIIPAVGSVIFIGSLVIAAGVAIWGAVRHRNREASLMAAPLFLLSWFSLRDAYVVATLPAHSFNMLIPYVRPLFLGALTVVLMRRMSISLDRVDRANEDLAARLAERESELAVLHEQERARAVQLVREHERERLTHDLHDGLSGHLVSIIALSERGGDRQTEQAARDALNDLRLVIYSLDLGDRELPLALANFRERLVPQLQRLGIELDWSLVGLPEVSGVTPGNALAVLRILQEAITNALKHGPARRIVIQGADAADGMVAITVENDGRAFTETAGGHGLANMRRRARQLQGRLIIESVERGVKLTVLLPNRLPDFADEPVA